MSNIHEEEALGKAYDAHLLAAPAAISAPVPLACGPRARARSHRYAARTRAAQIVPDCDRQISRSRDASRHRRIRKPGAAFVIISIVFFGVLVFDFLAQYIQIRIMQRVGQQTMYDMRTAIFRHIQRLPMTYFDRNPVGRLVTRVTTDVDALNDLFAAGVVTMINDFFLLAVLAGWLFSIDHASPSTPSPFCPSSSSSPISSACSCATPTAAFVPPLPASTPTSRNTFPA